MSAQIHVDEILQLDADQQQYVFYCKHLTKSFVVSCD